MTSGNAGAKSGAKVGRIPAVGTAERRVWMQAIGTLGLAAQRSKKAGRTPPAFPPDTAERLQAWVSWCVLACAHRWRPASELAELRALLAEARDTLKHGALAEQVDALTAQVRALKKERT